MLAFVMMAGLFVSFLSGYAVGVRSRDSDDDYFDDVGEE